MGLICVIKQRDYVGGGQVDAYGTKDNPAITKLFKDNFSGIEQLANTGEYRIKLLLIDEKVVDRFGDKKDCIQHIAHMRRGNEVICETSFGNVKRIPWVNIRKFVDVAIIEFSKETTACEIYYCGKKICAIHDTTKEYDSVAYIDRILVDFKNKVIYNYNRHGDYDEVFKTYNGFRVQYISIEEVS